MKWKKLSRKLIHETPWMKIFEDQTLNPAGEPTTYTFIEAQSGAYVIAVQKNKNGEHEICLVQQSRYTNGTDAWELPGGGAEQAEDYKETGAREAYEEARLRVSDLVELSGKTYSMNGISSHSNHYFITRNIVVEPFVPDPTEGITDRQFFTIKQITQMMQDERITDALTIAGLARAFAYLGHINTG